MARMNARSDIPTKRAHQSQASQSQPSAPPVYRPTPLVQLKPHERALPVYARLSGALAPATTAPPASSMQRKQTTGAPPVYRPSPVAAALPAVYAAKVPSALQGKVAAIAPPIYRPVVAAVQPMSVRGTVTAAVVSGPTRTKHVVPTVSQAVTAVANYGDSTFVASDADLTAAVDGNAHNFLEANGVASARYNFNAMVTIYQFEKRPPFPAGLAKTQPVDQTINGVATNCEIGVVKGGDDAIKVTHFKKV
jgi:hypothetical protein